MGIVPYRQTRRAEPRKPLDQQQIVEAALVLLDEVGLDALTMRALATRLGVKAAALYRHVKDKQELLVYLSDRIAGELPELDPKLGWREQLMQLARAYRRNLTVHRDAPRVLAESPPFGPKRLRGVETVLSTLKAAGLSDQDAARTGYHFNNYVTEFAADEARMASASAQFGGKRKLLQQTRKLFRSLPAEEFPTLHALADALAESDQDASFEFGMELWLQGLEQYLKRAATRPA